MQKILYGYLAWILLLGIYACADEPNNFGSMAVQLSVEEGGQMPLDGIEVSISNVTNGANLTALSDEEGTVIFPSLTEGIYSIKVDGYKDSLYITATANDIRISRFERSEVPLKLSLMYSGNNSLVIKELYYTGSNDPSYTVMFRDQFIEIFNNSDKVIYADSLYVANLYGDSYPDQGVGHVSSQFDINKNVYADWVARVPGNGTDYPINPGEGMVIALNAVNFQKEVSVDFGGVPSNEVDLSKARLEFYSVDWLQAHRGDDAGNPYFDLDNPDVPNMDNIYIGSSLDMCLWDMTGTSAVIFRMNREFADSDVVDYRQTNRDGSISVVKLMQIPVNSIIDGVEILNNALAGTEACKRLPASVDKGFNSLVPEGGDSGMNGRSARRKKDEKASRMAGRTILKDANNSTVDMEIVERPTPYNYNK